ncbi:DedA family protein (plasmid) [Agrobacterium salinitolerans]|uniref:DedA family protein n=1 Tax=Agrobacterium salinitolerans TaxID=1183413 RepID=UPI000DD05146|nr:DedA family protein [Agrobacterium salinitolerans]QXC52336.1 DedA family protein [Agrobacterium salinitolerans]
MDGKPVFEVLASDPLGALLPLIIACGAAGPMIVTFMERLVPVVPSYLLLVVTGVAAAHGTMSLVSAMAYSLAGSVLGCLSFYSIGRAIGERRSRRFFQRMAKLLGISSDKYRRWEKRFRANEHSLALIAQLIPTVRLISPGISGSLGMSFRGFVVATGLGVALWNGLFIGVGYGFATVDPNANASVLALTAVTALVVAEMLVFAGWRWNVRAPTR